MKLRTKFILGLILWTVGTQVSEHHGIVIIFIGLVIGSVGAALILDALYDLETRL